MERHGERKLGEFDAPFILLSLDLRHADEDPTMQERREARERALTLAVVIIEAAIEQKQNLKNVFRYAAGLNPERSKAVGRTFGKALGFSSIGRKADQPIKY